MATKQIPYKIYLSEEEMPKAWYNVKAHMKTQHPPFVNPATQKPCTASDLSPVFCDECIEQELNEKDERIAIPQGILDFYRMFRPSPLVRAYYLEQLLDTPAEIYYKFEGNNTSGSHKLNSAAAQAYYAKKQGLRSITTETGAGQWGTALAMASSFYGLHLDVYMVKVSAEQKPSVAVRYDGGGQKNFKGIPRHGRLSGLCHFGGRGKGGHVRFLPLCPWVGARSRAAASVRHRAGMQDGA